MAFSYDDDNDINMEEPCPPKIRRLHIVSNIRNRYARTVITSRHCNNANHAQQTTFSIILPDTAFIAGFIMEIEGKKYEANVKEKVQAQQEYDAAVLRGQSTAQVYANARNSNKFSVSANVKPQSDVTFILTYEELLVRKHSKYEIVLNMYPCQLVDDFQVDVHINETRPIVNVETPALRSGNEITMNITRNKFAKITKEDDKKMHVSFHPTIRQQKKLAPYNIYDGIAGQFVVKYDVERDPYGGEVLVNDGYFVHFFSPSELKPIPKLVVFVLDVSASMGGTKLRQLKQAMMSILDELQPGDYFNIIKFSNDVHVLYSYSCLLQDANTVVPATRENIQRAQRSIDNITADGCTNICDALLTALSLTTKEIFVSKDNKNIHKPQPIIIFLTDGQANVGVSQPYRIIEIITQRNDHNNKAAIFTLAFGDDAHKEFLKELAMKNSGFLRNIYQAADASLQLQDFYKQISNPVLTNVNFKYSEQVKDTTKKKFDILFNGSEFVVAGKIGNVVEGFIVVEGSTLHGANNFFPKIVPICPTKEDKETYGSLERLWAYMTIKHLLDKMYDNITFRNIYEKQALKIALKYSFVTPVTSLIVTKPENNDDNDLQWGPVHVASDLSLRKYKLRGGGGPARMIGGGGTLNQQPSLVRPFPLLRGGGPVYTVTSGGQKQQQSSSVRLFPVLRGGAGPEYLKTLSGSTPSQQQQSVVPFQRQIGGGRPAFMRTSTGGGSSQNQQQTLVQCKRQRGGGPEYMRTLTGGGNSQNDSQSPVRKRSVGGGGPEFINSKEMKDSVSTMTLRNSKSPPLSRRTRSATKHDSSYSSLEEEIQTMNPEITIMKIVTKVQDLQSHTEMRMRFINRKSYASHTTFCLVLPDFACATGFDMEVKRIKYKAQQQKKALAKQIYKTATAFDRTVGYVSNRAENRRLLNVTINLEALSSATFILSYKERIIKNNDKYKIITNLLPRVIIKYLEVDIKINDTYSKIHLDLPVVQSESEVMECEKSVFKNNHDCSVHVIFKPLVKKQHKMFRLLKEVEKKDLSRQLIVEFETQPVIKKPKELENKLPSPVIQPKIDYIVVNTPEFIDK